MSDLKQKVAFLHGLTKGLDVKGSSAEGKVLLGIIDILDLVAEEVDELYLAHQDLEDYVDTMDDDLAHLEEEVYDEDIYDDMVEVDCPECHEPVHIETAVMQHDDVEVTCPSCGGLVYYNVTDDYDRHVQHPGI